MSSNCNIKDLYDLSIWTLKVMKRRDLMWWSLTCECIKMSLLWKALIRNCCFFCISWALQGHPLSNTPANYQVGPLLPHFSWSLINFDKVETLPGSIWQSMFKLVVYAWWEHTLTYFRRLHKIAHMFIGHFRRSHIYTLPTHKNRKKNVFINAVLLNIIIGKAT